MAVIEGLFKVYRRSYKERWPYFIWVSSVKYGGDNYSDQQYVCNRLNIQVIRVSVMEGWPDYSGQGWPDYSGQECMEGWLRLGLIYRGVA